MIRNGPGCHRAELGHAPSTAGVTAAAAVAPEALPPPPGFWGSWFAMGSGPPERSHVPRRLPSCAPGSFAASPLHPLAARRGIPTFFLHLNFDDGKNASCLLTKACLLIDTQELCSVAWK